MSSSTFNLVDYMNGSLPDASDMRFGIVVSQWNGNITGQLLKGALAKLAELGVREENITVKAVPGSFELIFGCSQMSKVGWVDAIIAIGCVIRGDTPHFDYICQGVTQGLTLLNTKGDIPIVYGLLTTNNVEQAEERSGGILGNKGEEYAITAIKMAEYARLTQK